MDSPIEDAWRAQREAAAAQLTEVWRELLESTAGRTTRPHPQGLEDQLQKLSRSAADYAAVALQPVRDLVQGQRDLAEHA